MKKILVATLGLSLLAPGAMLFGATAKKVPGKRKEAGAQKEATKKQPKQKQNNNNVKDNNTSSEIVKR